MINLGGSCCSESTWFWGARVVETFVKTEGKPIGVDWGIGSLTCFCIQKDNGGNDLKREVEGIGKEMVWM